MTTPEHFKQPPPQPRRLPHEIAKVVLAMHAGDAPAKGGAVKPVSFGEYLSGFIEIVDVVDTLSDMQAGDSPPPLPSSDSAGSSHGVPAPNSVVEALRFFNQVLKQGARNRPARNAMQEDRKKAILLQEALAHFASGGPPDDRMRNAVLDGISLVEVIYTRYSALGHYMEADDMARIRAELLALAEAIAPPRRGH